MKIHNFIIAAALSAIILLTAANPVSGVDTAPRISDREIVERLTRLEEGQKAILREVDKRFEAMDKRFEAMDKRFEAFQNLVIGILASFTAIVAVTIGFAIWDRRTAVKPVENKVDLITEDLAAHKSKLSRFLKVLKKRAETDQELAAILRSFSL